MPNGFTGRILHVNLTQGTIEIEEPPESFYRTYMGGSAFGLSYILKEVPAGIDATAPENVLTMMCSVTTGAPISGLSRINVNAKSPMSGGIGDSQAGGFFPAELKFAGFDGIVFRGKSPQPVYLYIKDGKAELRPAAHLMGKTTKAVDQELKLEVGDPKAQVAQIGPAAERGVRFSSIINMASRNNGRTGMGLVMASKNLKAVVVRGSGKVNVANQAKLSELAKWGVKEIPNNADVDGLGKLGTASVVMVQNLLGSLPTRNYSEGQFEDAEAISGEKMSETILKRRETCYACAVRCKRVVEAEKDGFTVDPTYGGAEYETLGTFGSYCGVNDIEYVSYAHQICNEQGVDSISCGATIAFAMDCFERGIIGLADTGGIELRFGNKQAMLQVLNQIVMRSTSLGRILSEGSARAADIWGPEAKKCLITVKNEEAPAHMPQSKKSLGLIYAVNAFGADHQSSEHDWMYEAGTADLYLERLKLMGLTEAPPPGDFGPEKVKFATLSQIFYSMLDTLEMCQFVFGPAWTLYGPKETVETVQVVTGWDVTLDELMKLGERRINMLRAFNAREGFNRKDDRLPDKFFTPLTGTGPTAGVAVDRDLLEAAIDQYYGMMGWTSDGISTPAKMAELGLDWVQMDARTEI